MFLLFVVEVFREIFPEYENLFGMKSKKLLPLMFKYGVSICFETKEIIFLLPPSGGEDAKVAMIIRLILEARKNGRQLLCKTRQKFLIRQISNDGSKIIKVRRKKA